MLQHSHEKPIAPKRVVVMGSGGFVGGAILRHLQVRGIPVLPLTRREVDLLSADAASQLAGYLQPDDVFVAVSAIAPVKNAEMLKDNISMIAAMADALKRRPVIQVLNIGSDAIYADSDTPLHEASITAPGSLHGSMHLVRDIMLSEAAGAAAYAALRPTLIYGADDPHNGYGPNRFRRLAGEGRDIVLFGAGEERRDHVLVDDVAELAVRMILHRSRGVLNAATGSLISFRKAAEIIVTLHGNPVAIVETRRSGPMPHNGYRPFDPAATAKAFPDFTYVKPEDGFARVHADMNRRPHG
jgi:UDP-glucose 4-epimerase